MAKNGRGATGPNETLTLKNVAEMAWRCAGKVESQEMSASDGASVSSLLKNVVQVARVQLEATKAFGVNNDQKLLQ